MAFDSRNTEAGGTGDTQSKNAIVQVCDLSQVFQLVKLYVESAKYGVKELKSYRIFPGHLNL